MSLLLLWSVFYLWSLYNGCLKVEKSSSSNGMSQLLPLEITLSNSKLTNKTIVIGMIMYMRSAVVNSRKDTHRPSVLKDTWLIKLKKCSQQTVNKEKNKATTNYRGKELSWSKWAKMWTSRTSYFLTTIVTWSWHWEKEVAILHFRSLTKYRSKMNKLTSYSKTSNHWLDLRLPLLHLKRKMRAFLPLN